MYAPTSVVLDFITGAGKAAANYLQERERLVGREQALKELAMQRQQGTGVYAMPPWLAPALLVGAGALVYFLVIKKR